MFPVPWSVLSRLSLDEVRLAGSHNSTLGKEDGGDRRSLKEQLEMGLRVVEIDMFGHPDGFQLGHKAIAHQTAIRVPGNPATVSFVDWLNVVRDFVNSPSPSSSSGAGGERARRLPLILYLDLKNDHLARVKSAQEHNLASLNQAVETAFAGRLVTVDQFERMGRRPTLADLEGKVMVVLTGHEKTRWLYRHDSGYWPTVSVSSRHQVLQVHCARAVGNGALWYWVGRVCDAVRDPIFPHSPDSAVASVDWFQHGWLKVKGHHPTAAYNAQGWIVVVYEYDNPIGFGHSLRYVTAQVSLATSYPIVLQRLNVTLPNDGHLPFVDLNDDNAVLLAYYESPATLCLKYGSLDPRSASISWSLSRSLPVIPRPSVSSLSFRFRDRSSHAADLHIIQSPGSPGSSGSSGSSFSAGFGDLPRSLESEVVATPAVVHGVDKCPIPGRAVSVLVSSSSSLVFYSLASTAQLGEGTEPIWLPINFKQVCFIDHHPYDTLVKSSEAYFHAHNATRDPGQWAKRKEGDLKFVRAWRLNHDLWRKPLAPHINFVATDNPFDPAFVDFCKSNNVFLDNPAFVNFEEPAAPLGLPPPSSIAPSPLNTAIVDISAYSSSSSSSLSAETVAAGVDNLAVSYGSSESASPYSSCPPGYWD